MLRKIKDLPKNLNLVQNSQDIKAILDSIGRTDLLETAGCLFVEIAQGDYSQVWLCNNSVPWTDSAVEKIL